MEVAGWPQFRKNMHLMYSAIRRFRDLEINFLAVCAEKFDKNERGAYHFMPKMTGQLARGVQGMFDIVGWLVPSTDRDPKTGVGPRRLFVQPQSSPAADAKCRLASYPLAWFDDPVMEDIMRETGYIHRAK
jgi:hypothetical protein